MGLQGWKDLDLMEGFEKGLGGHAWPCKGGVDPPFCSFNTRL